MPGVIRSTRGCEELKRMGLLDTSWCCEICHSAERYVAFALGPCHVALPDGGDAFVCCAGKKQLLTSRQGGSP